MEFEKNTAKQLSEDFAVRIIKLYKYLSNSCREYDLFRQLLRSGTSIAANLFEAECAISKKDFASKVYISLKETSETQYWLRILHRAGYLSKKEFDSIYADAVVIRRILTATTKTLLSQESK